MVVYLRLHIYINSSIFLMHKYITHSNYFVLLIYLSQKNIYFEINITMRLVHINVFRKYTFVNLSLLHIFENLIRPHLKL